MEHLLMLGLIMFQIVSALNFGSTLQFYVYNI